MIAGSYYNELEAFPAQWLRNLQAAGHIAAGTVDERSIKDVKPSDLAGFTQAHFFAGIGGWSHALRLAGIPDSFPVWTGSCPCQPFSASGAQRGFSDERHLWPEWFRLIRECLPPIIFGEQVASPAALEWLDLVFADLEGAGYSCGSADLCAASVGAPHIRQRLYWMGYSCESRGRRHAGTVLGAQAEGSGERSAVGSVADQPVAASTNGGRMVGSSMYGHNRREEYLERLGPICCVNWEPIGQSEVCHWSRADWLPCSDGKARPVEPGTFPLADGFPARVGKLRAYGNAIVPQVAAKFILASLSLLPTAVRVLSLPGGGGGSEP